MDLTVVYVSVKPESMDSFLYFTSINANTSITEKENARFDFLQSVEDPSKFVLYEVYASSAGSAAHKETSHYLAWRAGVADAMADPRKGVKYTVHGPAAADFSVRYPSMQVMPSTPLDITLVHISCKEGTVEKFIEESLKNAAGVAATEPANLRFDCLQMKDDPLKCLLVEVYLTAEDAAKHKETPHYLAWRAAVADMMAEPRKGVKYKALWPVDPRGWKNGFA
mmetsp:Transcript_63053/g.119981  ORF Transcript_63053/g.119981 Transcript_63053/m.119981 type:complete len:224 (-) Transcript_63053:110-781(-)